MEEKHNNIIEEQQRLDEEQEIDLLELARKLWAERKRILRWAAVAAVAGLVIAFSIPREYTTTIKLAPEAKEGGATGGNLGALAAMAGINVGGGGSKDAVNPQLYPDIVSSVPFSLELFDVPVTDIDGEKKQTVREYLTTEISSPWWSYITRLPGMAIGAVGSIFSSNDNANETKAPNSFHLTPQENAIVAAIGSRVAVDVDAKTSIISISVTMQDPMVSAMLADTVASRLKTYVTDYRTGKARADLEYAQKLNDEAKNEYYAAQQRYATYMDKNHGVILHAVRNEEQRLDNEMQLAYNLYNTTAQQLQVAKAKVQAITPVYTVLQPATVPLAPSKPSKLLIIVGCIFIAVVACCAWILFGRDLVTAFRNAGSDDSSTANADSDEPEK